MAKNRANIRQEIRELLREFSRKDVVATGGIDASAIQLPVTSPEFYAVGDLLVVGDEQMECLAIDTDNNVVSVSRGYGDSVAAAHLAGVTIDIVAEASDRAINQFINYAINELYPWIWIEDVDETLTTSSTTREYSIPTDIDTVFGVEIYDGSANYIPTRRWLQKKDKLILDQNVGSGRVIRIRGVGYQAHLSSDSTAFSIPDRTTEFIVYHATVAVLEARLARRIKTTEYPAAVNERAGQPPEMLQVFSYLKKRVLEIKDREARPFPAGFMPRSKSFMSRYV